MNKKKRRKVTTTNTKNKNRKKKLEELGYVAKEETRMNRER